VVLTDWGDSLMRRRAVRFDVQMDRDGFRSQFAARQFLFFSLSPQTSALPRSDSAGYSFHNGAIVLWKRVDGIDRRQWGRLSLRETYNAVLLPWVLDRLQPGSRIDR
jgi:hypothetical protein